MARLVVKRTPWWVAHRKLVVVWLPLASLQAATLAGLGYFYHRLDDLEQKTETSALTTPAPITASAPVATPAPVVIAPPAPPPVVIAPEPIVVATLPPPSPAHDVPDVRDANVSPPPLPAKSEPEPKAPVEPVKPAKPVATPAAAPVKREVKTKPPAAASDRTATANRSGSVVRQLTNTTKRPDIEPLPVQVDRVWVYLGELRDYGWYDQKLHIAPSSGLPAVGNVYLTQYIASVHAAPYGRQLAGKFHLGERVLVHDVRRGRGDDVWGLVSAQ